MPLVVGSYQGCNETLHGLAAEAAGDGYGDGEVAADGDAESGVCVHEALAGEVGIYLLIYTQAPPLGSVFWRASSAAACPSLGGRTPTSFTTARRPRTRTAEREVSERLLLVGAMGRWGWLVGGADGRDDGWRPIR